MGRMKGKLASRTFLSFAWGARSAFDLSGLALFDAPLFPPAAWVRTDPEGAVAEDMRTVVSTFRGSYVCGVAALDAGESIEQLEPGCSEVVRERGARDLAFGSAVATRSFHE